MSDGSHGDCACCGGLADRTPVRIVNRPGLPAIAYRAGTYARFRESMIAGLSDHDRPALRRLTTRESDDVSIAMLDAWAVAADVITFYTERIANENYLGTATERRSIAGQAGLIGYRLKPGVAASAWLALTAEAIPAAPDGSPIPVGTRVQTIPGPDERAQSFETVAPLVARPEWNRLDPLMRAPRSPRAQKNTLTLAGTGLALHIGSQLLMLDAEDADAHTPVDAPFMTRVTRVTVEPGTQTTTVTISPAIASDPPGAVAVYLLEARAALFGFNAPNPMLFDAKIRKDLLGSGTADDWAFTEVKTDAVALDSAYEGIVPGGWAVLSNGANTRAMWIGSITEIAKSDYAISARVTSLALQPSGETLTNFSGKNNTRRTVVSLRSQPLPLAPVEMPEPLWGDRIALAAPVPSDAAERRLLVRGRRARASYDGTLAEALKANWNAGAGALVISIGHVDGDPDTLRWILRDDAGDDSEFVGDLADVTFTAPQPLDPVIGEVVAVEASPDGGAVSDLLLTEPLRNVYSRQAPIELFGNIAEATHGETAPLEILGSGDAAREFQHFTLRSAPLTFVASDDPSGAASTLEVRVNDIRWHEVPSLFAAGPRDRVYTTRAEDDGRITITFGDGRTGARLPTGADNVIAHYRVGVGRDGEARAEQIALPIVRPLGLRAAINPLPVSGADDPQTSADARSNAPRSVLTLGRVVSLHDYADFAADHAGVAEATAVWTWDGRRRGVHVTIASANGRPAASTLIDRVRDALQRVSQPRVDLVVSDFRSVRFTVTARLRIDPDHDADRVRDAVRAALIARYAFARRTFGQGVSESELAQVIHGVDGVVGVRIERLHRSDDTIGTVTAFLPADAPVGGDRPSAPGAEILTLEPEDALLEVDW